MQIQGERNPHPPPLSLFEQIPIAPISFSDLMPSLFLSLSPPRFAFQTGSPPQPPSRVCGPLYTVGASIPSLPARQFHLQRCCGSHPGALSSSPQASTNLLSKRTGSASSCLPELGLGRC